MNIIKKKLNKNITTFHFNFKNNFNDFNFHSTLNLNNMQSRREVAVFDAVSSSTNLPDAVSTIITVYVITKEADEIIQTTRLTINLSNRIHFIHTYLAMWEGDKRKLERMIQGLESLYEQYKYEFVMQPWLMTEYREYISSTQLLIQDITEDEQRLDTFWARRIPLEFQIDESDM